MEIMTTKTIECYKYSELSDKAKEKARDWYRAATDCDSFWQECVLEDAKSVGELLGIDFAKCGKKPVIYYRGFWSQGDGACFEGTWRYSAGCVKAVKDYAPQDEELHRIAKALRDASRKVFYKARAEVDHTGWYYHENSVSISVYSDERDVSLAKDDIAEALRDFMCWIYRQLEKEWDYQNSDEHVAEVIEINEYDFDADGGIV